MHLTPPLREWHCHSGIKKPPGQAADRLAQGWGSARCGRSGLVLGRQMVVILDLGFVAAHLTVKLVGQLIDSGVQVGVGAFGKQVAALDMHIALGALTKFLFFHVVNGQEDFHINHLVKVPGDAIEFAGHIAAQGGCDFKVVAADRQVHKDSSSKWVRDLEKSRQDAGRLAADGNLALELTMRLEAGNCNPALQQNVGLGGGAGAIIRPMFMTEKSLESSPSR
jgi:hypothetical protein